MTLQPTPAPSQQPTHAPLFYCDFDSDTCGFDYTTDYDWTRLMGSTPSSSTGPSSDYTSGSGYYMYVEGGDPNSNVGPYTLTSPTFAGCVGEVNFCYHLYGSGMGTLQLEETTGRRRELDVIWTKSGDQGNSWQGATVSIATVNVIQMRWVGTTGSETYGWSSTWRSTTFGS